MGDLADESNNMTAVSVNMQVAFCFRTPIPAPVIRRASRLMHIKQSPHLFAGKNGHNLLGDFEALNVLRWAVLQQAIRLGPIEERGQTGKLIQTVSGLFFMGFSCCRACITDPYSKIRRLRAYAVIQA